MQGIARWDLTYGTCARYSDWHLNHAGDAHRGVYRWFFAVRRSATQAQGKKVAGADENFPVNRGA